LEIYYTFITKSHITQGEHHEAYKHFILFHYKTSRSPSPLTTPA